MPSLNPNSTGIIRPGSFFPGYATGRFYPCLWGTVSPVDIAVTLGKIYLVPFYCRATHSFAGVAVPQNNAAPTGNARLGVYNDSGGTPGTLNTDAGAVSLPASTGDRVATATIALTINTLYWLAAIFDAAVHVMGTDTNATHGNWLNYDATHDFGSFAIESTLVQGGSFQGFMGTQAFGALPSTLPALSDTTSAGPLIYLKG